MTFGSKIKICFLKGTKNIVGNRENAGYQHFLFFPKCFQNLCFSGSLKVGIVWQRLNWFIASNDFIS